MVNGISSRVHRSATSEIPRWIFLNAHYFREPVLFPTLQPSRKLTVTDVGGLIVHVRIMHTTRSLVNGAPSGSVALARERGKWVGVVCRCELKIDTPNIFHTSAQ